MTEAHTPTPDWPFLGPLEVHEPFGMENKRLKFPSIICPDGDAEMGNWMVAERVRWPEYAAYIVLAVNSHARLQRVADAARALDTAEDFSEPIGPGQDPQDWYAYNALRRELGEALADLLTLKE